MKEIRSLNKVTILKDINKERICKTKGQLTKKSLDDQLTDNVIKKFKQDIETETYSPIAFLHRHRHIVQTTCEKEFSGKKYKRWNYACKFLLVNMNGLTVLQMYQAKL